MKLKHMETAALKAESLEICGILANTDSPERVFAFLRDMLSEKEIVEFSRRFKVAKMLSEGVSYAAIETETGMSSATIARVSKFLTGEFGGYRDAISTLQSVTDKHHSGHRPRSV